MKIGLIDVDSTIPNLALMKLSAYHRSIKNTVEWWNAFTVYNEIYASKIFTFSKDNYVPKNAIKGGTGYDLHWNLPPEIEHIYPDYSLYGINYAMGYLTRGCINQCGFCVVPQKEGKLRKVAKLDEFWHGQKKLILLDNAITDCPEVLPDLSFIRDNKIYLDLPQGFNVRTITPQMAGILAKIRIVHGKQWKIAWEMWSVFLSWPRL